MTLAFVFNITSLVNLKKKTYSDVEDTVDYKYVSGQHILGSAVAQW